MGTILNDMGAYGGHGYYEPPVAVDNYELHPATAGYELNNYPNPFNPTTTIQFSNEQNQQNKAIRIEIYNIKGQKVRIIYCHPELVEGYGNSNKYSVTWNGTDENNHPVSSGIYLYKLNVQNSPVKKMILLK